jgi:hypothetical protein
VSEELDNIIAQLGELDRNLLLGRCEGWGSWMSISGSYMVSLGLGTRHDGSISFDTPLAKAVIERLRATPNNDLPTGNDGGRG